MKHFQRRQHTDYHSKVETELETCAFTRSPTSVTLWRGGAGTFPSASLWTGAGDWSAPEVCQRCRCECHRLRHGDLGPFRHVLLPALLESARHHVYRILHHAEPTLGQPNKVTLATVIASNWSARMMVFEEDSGWIRLRETGGIFEEDCTRSVTLKLIEKIESVVLLKLSFLIKEHSSNCSE